MKAIIFREHGGPEKLEYVENFPEPTIDDDEILVRVRACAMNHLDIWVRQGLPGPQIPMPHILGSDISGVVASVGRNVKDIKINDEVLLNPGLSCRKCAACFEGKDSLCDEYKILGYQTQGGYAEYVKVKSWNAMTKPEYLSFEEAAGIPLVFLTAYHMLFTRAGMKSGESVLVMSAGSGVGIAAIQLAKLSGCTVIATVGSDIKIDKAKSLGADFVFNYNERDIIEEVKTITNGRGVDIVFEHTGGENISKCLRTLSKGGRLVTCGATAGPKLESDIRFLFVRQLSIIGSYMGGVSELTACVNLFNQKKLKSVIDSVFDLKDARKAHEHMLSRKNFGKIVIRIP